MSKAFLPSSYEKDKESFSMEAKMDKLFRTTEILKGRSLKLDILIDQVRNSILQEKRLKKEKGGEKAVATQDKKVRSVIQMLSKDLQLVRSNCCKTDAIIEELKQEINKLRKEKLVFNQIHGQLKKEFADKKIEMHHILKKSNEYVEQRSQAFEELEHLEREYSKETEEFISKWKELGTAIEEQEVAQKTIKLACVNRKVAELKRKLDLGNLDLEEEAQLRTKLMAVQAKVNKKEQNNKFHTMKALSYEEAFKKLRDNSGLTDLSEIIEQYLKTDDETFSLFNYIQSVNESNKEDEKRLFQLENEISRYEEEAVGRDAKEMLIKDLETQLKEVNSKTLQMDLLIDSQKEIFQSLFLVTQRLFDALGCVRTTEHIENGIDEENIMIWLGTIEGKACEIIQLFAMQPDLSSLFHSESSTREAMSIQKEEFSFTLSEVVNIDAQIDKRKSLSRQSSIRSQSIQPGHSPQFKLRLCPELPIRRDHEILPRIETSKGDKLAEMMKTQFQDVYGKEDQDGESVKPVDIKHLRENFPNVSSTSSSKLETSVQSSSNIDHHGLPVINSRRSRKKIICKRKKCT